jgi:2-polyprenyl-6-methoxyphenol hydroxylase-like FAD-dependent oxidoreductase
MKILISGGGIAGTTLAHWLHRYGFTPTVVERAPSIRESGYKIDIRGSALQVVERMGVLPRIKALRTDVQAGHIVDATGRRVASMDGDTFGGRTHDDAEIHRGDLNRLLYDLTKGQVEYLFGDCIATIDQTAVTFESGQTRHFDLIIGADGLHSHTRALTFGPESDFVHDMGYYVSVYSVPNHLKLDREELTYIGPGRTALTYSTARDSGAKAMFLFASPPLDHDHRDQVGQRKLLADAYAGEGWEVPTLLAGMADASDFYFDRLSQVHLNRWSKGRVALVGDAAYAASPASGQGTSLALVGAYVLAAELAGHNSHDDAFVAYEQRMRPFAEANQKLGPANIKGMVMRSKTQVWISMKILSLLSHMPKSKERMIAKTVEPIHRAATAITLD